MVYTLAKLQEDYQVPYIPTKGCNPEKILASATSGEVYNQALSCAAAGGNIPLIDYFLKKGASNIETALGTAGRYSNLNTVKYLISKGAKGYGHLLEFAAFGGNIDTMKFAFDVLRLEGFNINEFHGRSALHNAISAGHIEAVKFLIDNGIEIIPYNIQYAVSKNQYDIAEYLKQFI
jgi:ankyrin repeat protein